MDTKFKFTEFHKNILSLLIASTLGIFTFYWLDNSFKNQPKKTEIVSPKQITSLDIKKKIDEYKRNHGL
jgi:hypothetical protein